ARTREPAPAAVALARPDPDRRRSFSARNREAPREDRARRPSRLAGREGHEENEAERLRRERLTAVREIAKCLRQILTADVVQVEEIGRCGGSRSLRRNPRLCLDSANHKECRVAGVTPAAGSELRQEPTKCVLR